MAKVKDQSIPTDQFEETLDPPIDFKDQYRRALSEGIDHPKLPAGWEMVTFSKKESRPAQRSDWKYFDKPASKKNRDTFKDCAKCWASQYHFDFEVNDCHSAGSRHYFAPWTWIPGARNTAYNKHMQDCLNYEVANPGIPFPPCHDIKIYPSAIYYCPMDEITFDIGWARFPVTFWADVGTCGPGFLWTAPETWAGCPSKVMVYFLDSEGRKGCYELIRKTQDECCCAMGLPVVITYTTPAMQCGQQQVLSIDPDFPGCPPYSWFLDGGGSLNTTEGDTVIYTAPASNPGCSLNPHISVEDSCGTVCAIHLAVNCNTADADAFVVWEDAVTYYAANCGVYCGYGNGPFYKHIFKAYVYHCNGTLHRTKTNAMYLTASISSPISSSNQTVCNFGGGGYIYTLATTGWHLATSPIIGGNCGCLDPGYQGCGTWYLNALGNGAHPSGTVTAIPGNNDAWDVRTAAQKAAGCCPINPINGLPF